MIIKLDIQNVSFVGQRNFTLHDSACARMHTCVCESVCPLVYFCLFTVDYWVNVHVSWVRACLCVCVRERMCAYPCLSLCSCIDTVYRLHRLWIIMAVRENVRVSVCLCVCGGGWRLTFVWEYHARELSTCFHKTFYSFFSPETAW